MVAIHVLTFKASDIADFLSDGPAHHAAGFGELYEGMKDIDANAADFIVGERFVIPVTNPELQYAIDFVMNVRMDRYTETGSFERDGSKPNPPAWLRNV